MTAKNQSSGQEARQRAQKLGLYGLLARWNEFGEQPWVEELLACEEEERKRRSLERRLQNAKLGAFKPVADFDWKFPKHIDREMLEDLLRLDFVAEAGNVILIGPNGVGKTTLAVNIAYQAVVKGFSALRVSVSEMLNDLAAQEGAAGLTRRLHRYCTPSVLVLDEVGYLSFGARHGDLFFEVVSRRHQQRSIVLTTNKPFSEWNEIFPSSSCVTALIDRLVHKADIVKIEGESYRAKEARERARTRKDRRHAGRTGEAKT